MPGFEGHAMQLGFVSAILPDLPLEQVFATARELGYDCVELMCWPPGKAERRYAGVTHVDVTDLVHDRASEINALAARYGVAISGLGYYPNPLSADLDEARVAVEHIRRVLAACATLGIQQMNTFIGRDPARSIDDNWPRLRETWPPLVALAGELGVRIGIENCPMLFTRDEWPGGKNLAISPAVWRRLFAEIPAAHFGLNYDPSHLVWQQMDEVRPLVEFAARIHHVHAKDCRVDRARLDDVGILATPLEFHDPKLPGLGDVDWPRFFSTLRAIGYQGPVCVEVEDRDYEQSLDRRREALAQSAVYLRPFVAR
jgi:sugar phosphate isomerase/epimerase